MEYILPINLMDIEIKKFNTQFNIQLSILWKVIILIVKLIVTLIYKNKFRL